MITVGLRDIENAPDFNAILTEECRDRGVRFPLAAEHTMTKETVDALKSAMHAAIVRIAPGLHFIDEPSDPPSKP